MNDICGGKCILEEVKDHQIAHQFGLTLGASINSLSFDMNKHIE